MIVLMTWNRTTDGSNNPWANPSAAWSTWLGLAALLALAIIGAIEAWVIRPKPVIR
jgi:hypothetical protein